MTKILVILLTVLCISGCNDRVYVMEVNGKPLDCVAIGSGASCNWDKYNKTIEKKSSDGKGDI